MQNSQLLVMFEKRPLAENSKYDNGEEAEEVEKACKNLCTLFSFRLRLSFHSNKNARQEEPLFLACNAASLQKDDDSDWITLSLNF